MRTYRVHLLSGMGKPIEVRADRWEQGTPFIRFCADYQDKGGRKHTKFVDALVIGSVQRIEMTKDDDA